MTLIFRKSFDTESHGFTTSEVVISIALLSIFYASILTISSILSSNTRSAEIRPALDQVITSDIENVRHSSWAFLYHKSTSGVKCYLTDPMCPPNITKSIDDMRSICSNLNSMFLQALQLPNLNLTAASHSVFRDNTTLRLKRKIAYNVSHPIPLRLYDKNSIRLDYYLTSNNPNILSELSDVSNIQNNHILLRTYTFTPTAHSFCTGLSRY